MKKTLMASLAAVSVAGLIGGGTFAEWSDNETDSASIDAGYLDLNIDDSQRDQFTSFSRMVPGGVNPSTLVVGMSEGSGQSPAALDADLTLSIDNVVEYENDCGGDEATPDPTCAAEPGLGDGELYDQLEIVTLGLRDVDALGNCINPGPFTDLGFSGTLLSSLDTTPITIDTLSLGEETCVVLTAGLPFSSGNETQTDGVDFDFVWTLTQNP